MAKKVPVNFRNFKKKAKSKKKMPMAFKKKMKKASSKKY